MPMTYAYHGITDAAVPKARVRLMQHAIDTYASETNKVGAVWSCFGEGERAYRPHERSSTVEDIVRHQLLSERRFFGEFLGVPEPPAGEVMPAVPTLAACIARHRELALPRLAFLADQPEGWWTGEVPFFDVGRERVWVLWRRILHTAHHRTQLTVYLRLLGRDVPATYGPTADVTWSGADPTNSVEAAARR